MATIPTRVDQELFDAARVAGDQHSRSAAQQIDHWLRIGRELESAPTTTRLLVARVLAGELGYDEAPEEAQAIVRVSWDESLDAAIASLDLAAELRSRGAPWPENDDEGRLVMRDPRA